MTFFELSDGTPIIFDLVCAKAMKPLLLAKLSNTDLGGCYVYLDANKTPLYVGKTSQLFVRLEFHASKKGVERQFNWAWIGIVFSQNAHILEKELILRHKPEFNKLNK